MTVSALGSDNHFTNHLAVLDQPQPLAGLIERQHLVDHWLHLALLDQIHQALQVLVVEAVRADDLELEAPDVAQIFLRIIAGGRAANEKLATALEAAQRRMPGVPAGEVDHHVDAAFVAPPLRLAVFLDRPFRPVGLGVVDHLVGAHLLQAEELLIARRAGDDMRAEEPGEDHAACPDAAGGAEHDHALALLDGLVRDQHAVRGAVGDRQRRRLLEAHARRHRDELIGSDQAVFRHAAVEHLAHQAFLLVDRIAQHAVASLPTGNAGPDLGDLARHVEADDHRQRHLDAGHATHGEHVVIVERRRPHPDNDVAFGRLRHRVVANYFEIFEGPMRTQHEGPHCLATHAPDLLGIRAGWIRLPAPTYRFARDLFRTPVPTFRLHALIGVPLA